MRKSLCLGIFFVLFLSGCSRKNQEMNHSQSPEISGSNLLQTTAPVSEEEIRANLLSWDMPGANDTIALTGTSARYFKVYHSPDLWFEFSVQVSDQEVLRPNISLIRSGSVVSFASSYSGWPYQYIETFQKSSNETVKQAIQRIILSRSGVDAGCFVTGAENSPNDLVINRDTDPTCEWTCFPTEFCWPYAVGSFVSFFTGDDTADKFYYIDGGQDTLPGINRNPWFMEMIFIK